MLAYLNIRISNIKYFLKHELENDHISEKNVIHFYYFYLIIFKIIIKSKYHQNVEIRSTLFNK